MKKFVNRCFACSKINPIGLKLDFSFDNEEAITKWIPKEEYQGWPGFLHGGITATILDEVMAYAIINKGTFAATVEMSIKYCKKIPIGEEILAKAWIEKGSKKIFYVKAEIQNKDKVVLAEGSGKYFRIKI